MHKMVLLQAFPYLKEIFKPESDQIVVIVPDTPAHVLEDSRESLYKAGDGSSLEMLLGFRNVTNFSKIEQEDEAYITDDYVDMDDLQNYVEMDTLPENYDAFTQRSETLNDYTIHTRKDNKFAEPFVPEVQTKEKKPKKKSGLVVSDEPYYFLQTVRSHGKKGAQGSQGVLVTHDSFMFHRNNASRDYLMEWWQCKERKTPYRCQATASTQSLDGKTYFLRTCSKPEDHIHAPDKVSLFKDRLIFDIKMIMKKIPTTGKLNYEKAKNMAIEEASKTYLSDPEILPKVVALVQDPNFKLNRKISSFRQSFVAKINKELTDSGFNLN